jgi:ribosomal protein S18 acetylase RimI-like enzyme
VATTAIRKATVEDAGRIAALVSELGYPTSAEQMRRRLATILRDDEYETLVACDDGVVQGFVGTRLGPLYDADGQYGQIMALAVASDHQGRGLGRTLMQAAEASLIERGARVLVLTSGHHRSGAHAFYERMGYTFTGRRYRRSLPAST